MCCHLYINQTIIFLVMRHISALYENEWATIYHAVRVQVADNTCVRIFTSEASLLIVHFQNVVK